MSYSDPPPPPPQYGAPQPPYGDYPQKTPGTAIASLVLGIIGIPACGCLVISILAIVLGRIAKNDIAQSGGSKGGASLAQWGFILGIVGLALGLISWIASLATGGGTYNYRIG
jgi:hypothetical protein